MGRDFSQTWTRGCHASGRPAPLLIANGKAYTAWAGTAEGSVTPQGVLVMRAPNGDRFDGQIDDQGAVTGRFIGGCVDQMVWQKAPTSTTAFDGKYIRVSRESSQTASAPGAECPPDGVSAPLRIVHGVVWSIGGWEGTVSPQGAVVMRNLKFPRVDAQIDPQGTISGQTSGTECFTTFVWHKQPG
jgi:hypothetical protein